MTALEIKVALMERRVSMRAIARKIGVSPNAVSLVANRRMVSRRIMGELAGAIGEAASDVFPEYFKPAGRAPRPLPMNIPGGR